MSKSREKGLTVIELIGTFAIITLMSSLVISFYGKVSHKADLKKTEFLLEEIRGKIKAIYLSGNYAGISISELNENLDISEQIPSTHFLNGDIEICGNNTGYNVILKGLEIEDATKLEISGEGESIFQDEEKVFMGYKENKKANNFDNINYCI